MIFKDKGGLIAIILNQLVGDLFSVSALKNAISQAMKGRTIPMRAPKGEGETRTENQESPHAPEIKFGGLVDLSDEASLFAVIGMAKSDVAKKITAFMNNKLPEEWQRRHFRIVLGMLSQVDYVKKVYQDKKETPMPRGKPAIREKTTTVKTNLAVEFLDKFASLTEDEMLDICKAAGITRSTPDDIKKWLEKNKEKVIEKINRLAKRVNEEKYKGFFRELFRLPAK